MSRPVTLIAWRNANPYPDADVPTGPGRDVLVIPPGQNIRWDDTRHVMEDSSTVGAEPYWWSDPPQPPGPASLTVEALRRIFNAACHKNQQASIDDLDRLRRALDAIGTAD